MSNKSPVVWFTGLSGSGKSTLANEMQRIIQDAGIKTMVLDGDELRKGINSDLGFSLEDRNENIRRAAHIARMFSQNGTLVFCSFITPMKSHRDAARAIIGGDNFIEVYLNCSLNECMQRDVKGLYKKAVANQIADFTGVSMDYEVPVSPDIAVDSEFLSVEKSCEVLLRFLIEKNILFLPGRQA